MKQDHTDITIILDRSGSMQSVQADTIGGYNSFIAAQAKLPGVASMSLVQFDDRYEVVYGGVASAQVKPLDDLTFVPRGSTALLDAIGRTINDVGARLAALPEYSRPSKVILVILTDGQENASRQFNRQQVFGLITHQREVYGWDFVFLGANQDAIAAGASIGIAANSSLSYAADCAGTHDVFVSTSSYVANSRSGVAATFGEADRLKQQRS